MVETHTNNSWLISNYIPFILSFVLIGNDYLFLSYAIITKDSDM